jgi:Mlc titration factor MtfA (ptsG expression regulator)
MLTRRLPSNYEGFLNRNDKFYRELPRSLQRSFGSRLMKFMDDKEFKTREGLRLTWEMALVISAAAIKITFGLRDYRLSNFHTIIIYPGEFFSKASRQQVKGETNASGVIVFSWNDLQFGNSLPNDSINLGYHEFAHALFLNHLFSPFDDEFKDQYREWLVYLKRFSILARVKNKGIFREYASSNEAEFFAVAIENFFENPEHFKKELPAAYVLMVKILNQDPTAKP